jgi:hypothetical protein
MVLDVPRMDMTQTFNSVLLRLEEEGHGSYGRGRAVGRPGISRGVDAADPQSGSAWGMGSREGMGVGKNSQELEIGVSDGAGGVV